jgi:two-component system response regulator HydG
MHKVLVVDDDADLRLTVSSALSESHYLVDQASDGEEAVNRVRAGHYDLVLMDVNMPRMTGLEALKEIKAHDPSIIVIMLTASRTSVTLSRPLAKAPTTISRNRSKLKTLFT